MDDVQLRTGEEIGPDLLSAIQQSRISIPIFSKNYASSKWCLKELVKIVECRKTMNQHVLLVFYHVDPADIRHHTGTYAEALQEHNKRVDQGTIDEWKKALTEVGKLKGRVLKEIGGGRAFKRDQIPEEYLDLSKDIVKETRGLPLALEVIGSSLFGMEKLFWQDILEMLQNHFLDAKVLEKLKISFDGLMYCEQQIFLDIACFFNGMDKNIACWIWKQQKYYPNKGIKVLCQTSLVKIGENGELKMHDLLRDLEKEIIRQENLKVRGRHSRLWSQEEALERIKLEGLCIDFGDFMPYFSKLIWLRWKGCPPEFTLKKFHPMNLVVLDLSYSLITNNLMGWKHIKSLVEIEGLEGLDSLELLEMMNCRSLRKIGKISILGKLKELIFKDYSMLSEVECLEGLDSMELLTIKECGSLRKIGKISDLKKLEELKLEDCSMLSEIEGLEELDSVELLTMKYCGSLRKIGKLSSLRHLNLKS
ncbi:disease resistance protein L6-like [Macadamia integrifolia]|uniref:disease resistance protein L6-like n=1 Tax=Macadamia integrifolia TaxID=60698 RepID=UPI001C52995D|nr:disease resistance protein L6-like [Macadamia integrifolia]